MFFTICTIKEACQCQNVRIDHPLIVSKKSIENTLFFSFPANTFRAALAIILPTKRRRNTGLSGPGQELKSGDPKSVGVRPTKLLLPGIFISYHFITNLVGQLLSDTILLPLVPYT